MYLQPCVSSSSAILWFLSGDRSSNSIWGNIGSSHVKEPQSKHHGGGGNGDRFLYWYFKEQSLKEEHLHRFL